MADINGLSIAEHLGRRLQDVLPALWPSLEPLMKRVLEGESIQGLEYWDERLGPALPHRVFSISYEPARDEAGEVVGISVAMVDISEQKDAEFARYELEMMRRRVAELEVELSARKISPRAMTMRPGWQSGGMSAD
jgi:hypothetical protein